MECWKEDIEYSNPVNNQPVHLFSVVALKE